MVIAAVCFFALVIARPAEAGWRDYVSPAKNWARVKNCCHATSQRVGDYCHKKVERAKADQAKTWGLKLPVDFDPNRPLVVLIHGLDSHSGIWYSMAQLLGAQGYQVAYFGFPSDGPIAEDANRLADEMAELHKAFPRLRVDLIGHSMGGLIARGYIEGDRYTQPVDRFIALGPPNHGSPWTRERFLLEANEQYWLWRINKDWSPIWMFTDGHGEAADDLKPDSGFLKALNERPRRAGVRYTIVRGDHDILTRFGADAIGAVENCLPKRVWGLRQCQGGLKRVETRLAKMQSDGDGVVTIASANLEGVEDVITLHADHNTLAMSAYGKPPEAWPVIRERLAR
jgi:pimeloyl-ACP methyl ester carboxylesterase